MKTVNIKYSDFYKIAEYGNKNWKGCLTPLEIACNAYEYKIEYDESIKSKKPTHAMIELCKLINEDLYNISSDIDDMNISQMEHIISTMVNRIDY